MEGVGGGKVTRSEEKERMRRGCFMHLFQLAHESVCRQRRLAKLSWARVGRGCEGLDKKGLEEA
jgi:hypothetical protein